MDRRDLLKSAVAAPAIASALAFGEEAVGKKKRKNKKKKAKKPNVVLFITDQERPAMHFPQGWEQRHLPNLTRLKKRGVSFDNAFCSASMCSPSRASLFTGYFPAQHGVTDTLSFEYEASETQPVLPLDLPNMATVMEKAGYDVVYKGKWHLSKPAGWEEAGDPVDWTPKDLAKYDFARWDSPDAGANQDEAEMGAGNADNDGRFMNSEGAVNSGDEGVLQFIASRRKVKRPFFLIVSLVNPHDVLAYPQRFDSGGFDDSFLQNTGIGLPPSESEDLAANGKPTAQQDLIPKLAAGLGPLLTERRKLDYLNFYGNLMKLVDGYLGDVLRALKDAGKTQNTLIVRTSDHGEMGLSHGGMRQKMFNAYEETLRVPMVFSWPKGLPKGKRSQALVSHVDLLPTLATLLDVPKPARQRWQGRDYADVVRNPGRSGPNPYVGFTFDDIYCGQGEPLVDGANRLVAIREARWKLVRYRDATDSAPDEWEMYDLANDPDEVVNIAGPAHTMTDAEQAEFGRLKKALNQFEKNRLKPLRAA